MQVKDIMTRNIVSVDPSMGLRQLAKLLIEKNVSGVPVVGADGKFAGLVLEEAIIFQDKKITQTEGALMVLMYILFAFKLVEIGMLK